MKALLSEFSSQGEEAKDVHELLSAFPDSALLTIYANPLLIEYFSDNVQLLHGLDNYRHFLTKEWKSTEEV